MTIWKIFVLVGLLGGPLVLSDASLTTEADCEVLLEAISGSYEGDCKKGMAHGDGFARGEDTYEGEFRKGLPHGEGKYTWANGNVFTGTFKKGKKEGKGLLIKADGERLEGYWSDDEYIGENETPYQVTSQSPTINRITFRRVDSQPDQLEFKFTYLGKPAISRNFDPQDGLGVVSQATDYSKIVEVVNYPVTGSVAFRVETVRTPGGGVGQGDYVGGNFSFTLQQSGKWEITVEMRPQ